MDTSSDRAARPDAGPTVALGALLVVFFASGFAALVYQVLWLKELGRLFGVTAYAAATTLAVFFAGLAVGGWVFGRRARAMREPMRIYALLEVGIAVTALLYFVMFDLYRGLQEPLFGAIGYRPAALVAIKFALAAVVLFPPSFLMGGTLPVLAQYLVRRRDELGARTTLLYALNTVGAAAGAMAAGFVLPRFLGFDASYGVAIAINLTIAAIAWRWRRRAAGGSARADSRGDASRPATAAAATTGAAIDLTGAPPGLIAAIAAVSGLATLGLEVVWTRMYSQVLQNSVYTFSIILTVFLGGLAAGSAVAHALCRRARSPRFALAALLALSGVLVALTPIAFSRLAGNLDYLENDMGFVAYVATVFAGTALVIGPAIVAMGAIFPYLMKLSERHSDSAGKTVGQLAAINTTAAIAGSVIAGFVLLGSAGVWGSIRIIAAFYVVLAIAVWPWRDRARRRLALVPIACLLVLLAGPAYGEYSRIWLDVEAGEELVEGWEGPAGSVAVVRHGERNLRIRVNSSYNLGSSASAVNERLQAQLGLALHPDPKSVYFLGLGTGITASGALGFPLERILVCEVNPDVVTASREHFRPWLRGLFEDERVTVLPEDGRTWLAATTETFDVVIADIFLSFKAGVGSLYTREHFEVVRDRLNEGGVFVQWLPMFDMSEPEFDIVARTMREVFPSVTLWRRSLSPSYPVYALVGRLEDAPVDPEALAANLEHLRADESLPPETWLLNIPFAAYAGNVSALEGRFEGVPVNTDDRTRLEYLAPITERERRRGDGGTTVLAWTGLLDFSERLLEAVPPARDPHLVRLDDAERAQVSAGVAYYGYLVHRELGPPERANAYRTRYRELLGLPARP